MKALGSGFEKLMAVRLASIAPQARIFRHMRLSAGMPAIHALCRDKTSKAGKHLVKHLRAERLGMGYMTCHLSLDSQLFWLVLSLIAVWVGLGF